MHSSLNLDDYFTIKINDKSDAVFIEQINLIDEKRHLFISYKDLKRIMAWLEENKLWDDEEKFS